MRKVYLRSVFVEAKFSDFNLGREFMEIAIIVPFQSIGGAETYSLNLSIALSHLKNNVTMFVNSRRNKTKEYNVNENFKIKYLKSMCLPIDPGNPFSAELSKDLVRGFYDIIHVHQLFTFFNIFSCLAGKTKRIPTILTDHGGGWRLAAFPRLCAAFPDAFAAVSKFSSRWLMKWAPNKRHFLVYGGVDTSLFHPNYEVDELKEEMELDGSYIVLCVGRVVPHKGIDVLIRTLRFLPSNTKLLIVGPIVDKQYLSYLKRISGRKYEKQVVITGAVKTKKLPLFYNLCHVFVQPSLHQDYLGRQHRFPELLGLTKLEAMACAKPVVVSNAGALPEKVVEGKNGYVTKAGDEKELAESINALLCDVKLRKKMGEAGLSLVKKELTWKATANRIVDCYESILNC